MKMPAPLLALLRRIGPLVAVVLVVIVVVVTMKGERTITFTPSDETLRNLPALDTTPPHQRIEFLHEEGQINLPPVGNLPSLQAAMRNNRVLRQKVEEFVQRDDAYLFANFRQTDADIATILLLWGGADVASGAKTAEGLDSRVDRFLRGVYAESGPVINNPRMGGNPWPRLFLHYKLRLIAQTRGGAAPFNGELTYDVYRDRLRLNGTLKPSFFRDYGAFLNAQKDPVPFRNNLVYYIDQIRPLTNLTPEENEAINFIR